MHVSQIAGPSYMGVAGKPALVMMDGVEPDARTKVFVENQAIPTELAQAGGDGGVAVREVGHEGAINPFPRIVSPDMGRAEGCGAMPFLVKQPGNPKREDIQQDIHVDLHNAVSPHLLKIFGAAMLNAGVGVVNSDDDHAFCVRQKRPRLVDFGRVVEALNRRHADHLGTHFKRQFGYAFHQTI